MLERSETLIKLTGVLKMSNEITNDMDVIDSRDIIERIEELESFIEDNVNENSDDITEWKEELRILAELAEEGENYSPDWSYGSQLIHENYFEEYMDEMLEDCGDIPKDIPCYLDITVNYDMLKWDYTELDFDGETYYIR